MIGRKYQVGIGKESIRGTKIAPTFWLPLLDMPTIENKPEYENNTQGIGVIVDTDGSEIVKEYAEGEMNGKIRDNSFGLLLLVATGSVASAESADTGVYEHTFSLLNSNTHPSLTVEVKHDNEQLAYSLAMLNSLRINIEVGKFIEFNAGVTAKKGVSESNTPSYDADENEFTSRHVSLKIADNLAGLDSASEVDLQSIELSVNKNIEPIYKLKSTEPAEIKNKVVAIEGNFEAMFDDTTLKAFHEGNAEKAIRIEMVNDAVTIGASSNPGLKIDLAKVKFHGWDKSGGHDELVSQSINFKAHYSMTDGKMYDIVLTNTNASY